MLELAYLLTHCVENQLDLFNRTKRKLACARQKKTLDHSTYCILHVSSGNNYYSPHFTLHRLLCGGYGTYLQFLIKILFYCETLFFQISLLRGVENGHFFFLTLKYDLDLQT